MNQAYLSRGKLGYSTLEGYWTDAGTLESLNHANQLVRDDAPLY